MQTYVALALALTLIGSAIGVVARAWQFRLGAVAIVVAAAVWLAASRPSQAPLEDERRFERNTCHALAGSFLNLAAYYGPQNTFSSLEERQHVYMGLAQALGAVAEQCLPHDSGCVGLNTQVPAPSVDVIVSEANEIVQALRTHGTCPNGTDHGIRRLQKR